jgi:hypothetical protein
MYGKAKSSKMQKDANPPMMPQLQPIKKMWPVSKPALSRL